MVTQTRMYEAQGHGDYDYGDAQLKRSADSGDGGARVAARTRDNVCDAADGS